MKPKFLLLRDTLPIRKKRSFHLTDIVRTLSLPFILLFLVLTNAYGQVAPVLPPAGGFHIDGNLRANTPTAGVGDWVNGPGGSGGYLINDNGTVINTLITYNLNDPYSTNTDIIFTGGSKVNDNPVDWSWSNQSAPPKNDINRGLIHIAKASNDDIWLIMAGDRLSTNGDAYIDFELLQNTMTRNTVNGHFNTAGPDSGRTVNDLLITIEYSNGGGVSNITYRKWLPDGTGFSYQVITPGPLGFAVTNSSTVDVPYGAFGSTTYNALQFVEAAVNLSQVIQNTSNTCQGMAIKTIFIKTKASTSPTAELKDFIEPLQLNLEVDEVVLADVNPLCITAGAVTLTGTPSGGVYSGPGVSGNTFNPALSGAGMHSIIYTKEVQAGCFRSDTITIQVDPASVGGVIAPNTTVCSGSNNGTLTLSWHTGNVVKWQRSVDGGATWIDIANTTTSQGYNNLTQTTMYRAVVQSGVCSPANSSPATITVDPVSVGGVVAVGDTVCSGNNSGTLTLSGNVGAVVKWQRSIDGGVTWIDIANTTTSQAYSNLTQTTMYRAVVQSGVCNPANSSPATITVDPVSVGGVVAVGDTVCSGSNGGTLTLSGNVGAVIKWQRSVNGGATWIDIANTTTSQAYSNLTQTTMYRAVVQSGVCNPANSSPATITVDPVSVGGVVAVGDTVCSGSNGGTLTLSGNVGAVIKWQRSIDGGATWIDIANTTTSQGYSNLTQTTMYRAVVQSGVCNPANSSPATITVDPVSVGGVVAVGDTVCSGSNSGTLTLSGNVGAVIKWQRSVNGGATWIDIANTTTSQAYSNLTQTTMYRAVVQSGVCSPANSNPATITVDPVSVGGAVTASATVCSGSNSGTLNLTGNIGVVIKWQRSIDGGATWIDIANTTTSQAYSNLTQTTMYRAVVQSGVCNPANSNPATITVDPVSVGGAVTASATVCSGSNGGTLTLSGNIGAVIKWQRSVDGGTTWIDIANTTTSQGYSNLTQTTMYRAVVQSGVCNPANSNPATITVDPVSVGGAVTASATVCSGNNSGTLNLSGNVGAVVKWQRSIDGGVTWIDIANTTSSQAYSNLTQTTMYRAVVQSGVCNPANSNPATITVDPVSVGGAVTASATVCSGSNSGTLNLTGNIGVVIKWQRSVDGGTTWIDIANTTTSQAYSNLTQTTMYRAVVQSGVCNPANSNPATITVDPVSVGGAVTASATVCSGNNSGTLNLSGNVGAVVKWQRSIDGGVTWIDIANTTTSQAYSNLTQTTMYRAVVQSGVCGLANSNPATITVDPVSVGGAVTASATVCSGSNSGTLTLSGNVGAVVKWQRSVDGGTTWIDIANTTTSQGYNNLTQTTMYRAVVQSGVCSPANSTPATITVDPVSVGGVVAVSDTVCFGNNSGVLTLSGNIGVVVKWQRSVNSGITWIDIANTTTSQAYSNLTQTTMYRAVVQSGVCSPANSTPATITIDPVSVGGAVTASATVCSGNNSGTLNLSGNIGVVVKWQRSIDGGATWIDIANTTSSQGYSNLTQTTMYRAVVQSGVCNPANSNPATITVDPVSVGGAVTASVTVCSGSNSGTLNLSGNIGVVVKWQRSIDGGATWIDIANTTSSQGYSNLTQTTMYRAVVQSGVCNPANSSPATISVDPVSVGGAVTADATVCSGNNGGTLNLSGNVGTVVKWQRSIDGGATWIDIANTTTSQAYSNLTQTTMYRAVVQSGVCSPANSSPATISVDMAPVGGVVSDDSLCANTETGTLTLSGYSGTIIKWQSSIDGGTTWFDIANTSNTLGVGPLTVSTMYRAVIGSGVCANVNSAPGTVLVTNCQISSYCTYTQGFYGNLGGLGCDGDSALENSKTKMLKAFDLNGILKVVFGKANIGGSPTQDRAFTLFRQDIVNNNIYQMLPGGGTPAALGIKPGGTTYGQSYEGATYSVSSTWTAVPLSTSNSTMGKIKNNLLSQTMTLFFNLNNGTNLAGLTLHDSLFVTSYDCATGTPIPGAPVLKYALPHNVLMYISAPGSSYPLTVVGLYQLANDKLGGAATVGISATDVTNAVDAINNAFDGCRSLVGYYDLPGGFPLLGGAASTEWQDPGLSVTTYPNPFKDKIVFNITAQASSPCVIELYNMVGQRVQTLTPGELKAGIMQVVEFDVPASLLNGNYFYVVKAGDQRVSGKLISLGER